MLKRNKLKTIVIVLILLIIAFTLIYNITFKSSTQTINVGLIMPLSGDFSHFGNDVMAGVKLYHENNLNFKYIAEDDKGDSKESINAFNKLYSINDIKYYYGPFGPVNSEAVYSSQSNNQKLDTIFIAMSMCSEQFKKYSNMMCNYPSPLYQLKESLKFPKMKNKNKFYAVLSNDASGQALSSMISQISTELNLTIIGENKINTNDTEFSTVSSKIISENPEFVFIVTGSPNTNFKIVRELKEKGYKGMIIIGSDVDEKQVQEFKDVLEGVYFAGIAKISYNSEFLSAYNNKYGDNKPNLYQAYGYMWSEIIYKLASNNTKFTISDVQKYVNKNSNNLPIKGIKYNDGEIELPMKILLVKDGKLDEVYVS